jgi:cell division protease FtsH
MSYDDAKIRQVLKYKNVLPETNYNQLLNKIQNHQVSKIYFTNNLDTVVSEEEEDNVNTDTSILDTYSITHIQPLVTNSIADISAKNNVQTYFLQTIQPTVSENILNGVFTLFNGYVFPFLFLSIIISSIRNFAIGQTGGMPGGMPNPFSMNRNAGADKINMQKANISLASFAGSPEIFEECVEVVSYLKNETIYKNVGAEIPRGILLEGPPGTGKTLLAKAIASEADANFISVAASEFVEVFVGLGASKIRNLFKTARENKPCILFIDEIDAVGKQRGSGPNMGTNDEREQTLNQLLAEMDGFADNNGILVIAATNRKDVLDKALLRPGRFDRVILVPLPDRLSRKAILKVHEKNKNVSKEVNLDFVSELTQGFSGAQLKNLLNEAAIYAVRRGGTIIEEVDIMNALDKIIVGIVKRNDTRDEDTRMRVAIHETGHALLTILFKQYFELKKVSIQSTYNGAGGYTIFNEHRNISEGGLYTKDLLWKRIVIGMGGKAAETLIYGEDYVSIGATQDLKQANSLAQQMIGKYGMGKELEVFYNEERRNVYSEKTREMIDTESIDLINEAYLEAKTLLNENKSQMMKMIQSLLNNTTLYGENLTKTLL